MKLFKHLLILTLITTAPVHAQEKNMGATRSIADFSQLKVAGPFHVSLNPDRKGTIQIDADQKIIEKIITEVNNGVLTIRMKKRSYFNSHHRGTIAIEIPMPSLQAVLLSGSGKIHNTTAFSTTNLDVKLSGLGKINLNVNAAAVHSQLSGSGNIKIKGKTTQLNVKLSGSGNVNLHELEAKNGQVELSGSGKISVQYTTNLNAKIAGSGTVRYHGEPTGKLHSKVVGSGSLRKAN